MSQPMEFCGVSTLCYGALRFAPGAVLICLEEKLASVYVDQGAERNGEKRRARAKQGLVFLCHIIVSLSKRSTGPSVYDPWLVQDARLRSGYFFSSWQVTAQAGLTSGTVLASAVPLREPPAGCQFLQADAFVLVRISVEAWERLGTKL